jgi:D-alanyl-D-alanine carboxypeptidase (penicillin-binding protein 5/6)
VGERATMTASAFARRPFLRHTNAVLIFLAFLLAALPSSGAHAQLYETKARAAILIDVETGTVLFEKDADARMPPASMAKLMTMAVVFGALRDGSLKLGQEFVVSEAAWRQGGAPSRGTTMFAELGSSIRVEDLIRGVIVQSANDGCIVLAEGMAGSQEAFAELMNREAERLGLANSHFTNPTGYVDPAQYMSARDLATLTGYLIREFPDYYKIYSEPEFTWNKIRQLNRNPLIAMNIGADGLTTGSTDESGFGLAGSAVRNGQRLILVINGVESEKLRNEEARKLIDWGFNEFERVRLFDEDEVIAEARVFGGAEARVGLVSKGPLELLLPRGSQDMLKAEVLYDGPLPAPVEAGREVGIIKVTTSEGMTMQAPVYTAANVGVGGLQRRALDGIEELLLGWW